GFCCVRGWVNLMEHRVPYVLRAPVQTDRTGDAIRVLKQHMSDFVGGSGVTPVELARTINGRVRELPGSYETSAAVLRQMQADVLFQRPADYVTTLAARYRGMDAATLDEALRTTIDPDGFTWVVVGDRERVMPQLRSLRMPVEVVEVPVAGPAEAAPDEADELP